MKLTIHTDYSLRILIYLGTRVKPELASIKEIADTFSISTNHLGKIVFELGQLGLIETIRGRKGGILLAKETKEINLGYVVRKMENLDILECFDEKTNKCRINPACRLKHVFKEALDAYLKVLDSYTLADVMINMKTLTSLITPVVPVQFEIKCN